MPTKSIGFRIDEDLLKYLEERAEREHRTLSNMIISILLDAKERDTEPQPSGVRSITDDTIRLTQPIKKMYGTFDYQTGVYTPSEYDEE